jgi:hypothetical protein
MVGGGGEGDPRSGEENDRRRPTLTPNTHQISSGKVKTQKKANLSDTLASKFAAFIANERT